jgi:hypothetical protein
MGANITSQSTNEMQRRMLISSIPYQIMLLLFALHLDGNFFSFFAILAVGDVIYAAVYLVLHKMLLLSALPPRRSAFVLSLAIFNLTTAGILYASI